MSAAKNYREYRLREINKINDSELPERDKRHLIREALKNTLKNPIIQEAQKERREGKRIEWFSEVENNFWKETPNNLSFVGHEFNFDLLRMNYRNWLYDTFKTIASTEWLKTARSWLKYQKEYYCYGWNEYITANAPNLNAENIKKAQWIIKKFSLEEFLFGKIIDRDRHGDIKKEITDIVHQKMLELPEKYKRYETTIIKLFIDKVIEKFVNKEFVVLEWKHADIVLGRRHLNKYILFRVKNMWMNLEYLEKNYQEIKKKIQDDNIGNEWYLSKEDISFLGNIFKEYSSDEFILARPTWISSHHQILLKDDLLKTYADVLDKSFASSLYNFFTVIKKYDNYWDMLTELQKNVSNDFLPPYVGSVSGWYLDIRDDETIEVSGKSEQYGEADKQKVLDILKRDFPDRKFV